MTALTFGELFAGIGGFSLGFERAGMACKWHVEIDPFCLKVLTKHWPDVPKHEDVRDVGKRNLETVDVIVGGFPCQPHSVAGKQRGERDDRNLWPEFKRIIDELRPRWVVAENVPGIIHTYLDTVLSDLEGAGYSTGALNIPAVAFDARHRRERIFIVGSYTAGDGRDGRNGAHEYEREYDTVAGGEQPFGNGSNGAVAYTISEPAKWWGNRTEWGQRGAGKATQDGWARNGIEDGRWPAEPRVGRVADGIPGRLERLRALGNAVVPQVAEFIGRQIVAVEEAS